MSNASHGLRVSPAGAHDAYDPATGDRVGGLYEVDQADAAAYLPHQCDSWLIGYGAPDEVITSLRQLRNEADAAITYLGQQPEGTA